MQYGNKKRQRAANMLRKSRMMFSVTLVGALLSGCAIHPVQENVTRIRTQDIVQHIRCEARAAVFAKALARLEFGAIDAEQDGNYRAAQEYRSLSIELQRRWVEDKVFRFRPSELPTREGKEFYKRYVETVIVYDFLMQGIESNGAGLAADPVRLITGGTAGLTIGGTSKFTRDNSRSFQASDTFSELLELDKKLCPAPRSENFIYPISGRLGLGEIIDTFIEVNEVNALESKDKKKDSQVFADTMKFTTDLSGGLTPHVQIAAVGSRFGLAAPATVTVSGSRMDVHTLTIGLAMGTPAFAPSIGFPFTGVAVVRSRATSNFDAAKRAIENLIQRNFYENFRR